MNNFLEGQNFVIKKATKNKETQTQWQDLMYSNNVMMMSSFGVLPVTSCHASIMKPAELEEEEPYYRSAQNPAMVEEKTKITYTLKEMKSYNPYRELDAYINGYQQ